MDIIIDKEKGRDTGGRTDTRGKGKELSVIVSKLP
jgi:hypothetical protein